MVFTPYFLFRFQNLLEQGGRVLKTTQLRKAGCQVVHCVEGDGVLIPQLELIEVNRFSGMFMGFFIGTQRDIDLSKGIV